MTHPPGSYHLASIREAPVEASEIFDLIVKADEAVKYATPQKAGARIRQARDLLERARTEATAIDNRPLAEQAERRLADLDALASGGEAQA
jgi:hypothetical protein